MKRDYYYWLDPIRALAAIFVLLSHTFCVVFGYYSQLVPESQTIPMRVLSLLCTQGKTGVAIFFLLSGFLVGGRTLQRLWENKLSPARFAQDRAFRIGVPLLGAILLIIIVDCFLGFPFEPLQLLGQFFGLQGILVRDAGGVFYTLAYEIWFYIALFALLLVRNHRVWLGVAFGITAFGIFSLLDSVWIFIICLGVIAYFTKDVSLPRKATIAIGIFAAFVFCLYFVSYFGGFESGVFNEKYASFYQMICYGGFAVAISQVVFTPPSKIAYYTLVSPLNKVAKFSYSLYLTHYQVLKIHIEYGEIYHEVNLWTMSYFIGILVVCFLVAYIFYWIFERNARWIQTACIDFIHRCRS